MEASALPKTLLPSNCARALVEASRIRGIGYCNLNADGVCQHAHRLTFKRRAMTEVAVDALNSAPVNISWEIIVGSIAGVTPFVVAGIEFGKRINAQSKCTVCKGSGLVRREKYFFRCPRCGGFLPWQSWKRFFTG